MSIKVNATPGPWELCKFGENHPDALPGEVGVFAPNHPDSRRREDGTWHGVTICRGMTGPAAYDNATLIACVPEMLEVLKMVYRKHTLGDEKVGWDELEDKVLDALNNALGAEGFLDWLEGLNATGASR